MTAPNHDAASGDERVTRLEKAVQTLVWWLVQAQTGFSEKDARGITNIIATGDSHQEANHAGE